jgi:hypothetical protein
MRSDELGGRPSRFHRVHRRRNATPPVAPARTARTPAATANVDRGGDHRRDRAAWFTVKRGSSRGERNRPRDLQGALSVVPTAEQPREVRYRGVA